MILNKLVEISNCYGKNEDYVLAGGGNTSYKDDNYLYIKASGTSLSNITKEGFVKLNRKKLSEIWDRNYSKDVKQRETEVLADLMDARVKGEEHKRPSVETLLHNLLPYAYVVHLHPAVVNGLTCSKQGEEYAKLLFGDSFIWIENIEPGYSLAKRVRDELSEYKLKNKKNCKIIFLQNHGVFASADNVDEIDGIYMDITEKIVHKLVDKPDFSNVKIDKEKEKKIINLINKANISSVIFLNNKSIDHILKNQKETDFSCAFTPDHIVYCKANPLIIEKENDILPGIRNYKERYGYPPRIIIFADLGVFVCGENEVIADTAKKLYLDAIKIAVYAESFGGLSLMPQHLVEFIMNWEAESYRSSVNNQ